MPSSKANVFFLYVYDGKNGATKGFDRKTLKRRNENSVYGQGIL